MIIKQKKGIIEVIINKIGDWVKEKVFRIQTISKLDKILKNGYHYNVGGTSQWLKK